MTASADAQSVVTPEEAESALRDALEGVSVSDLTNSLAASDGNVTPQVPEAHDPGPDASPKEAVESGKEQATEKGKSVPVPIESKATESKPDPKSDAERQSKTWAEINAAKESLKAEREEFERSKTAFEAKAASVTDAATKAQKTADDYESFARDWEKEGRDDLAKLARDRANALRSEASEVATRAKHAELRRGQDDELRALLKEHPELSDQASDLSVATMEILKEAPVLLSYPKGLRHAVTYAKAHASAQRSDALQKELDTLNLKLADREKLLQPASGGRSAPSGEVPFEKLSTEEQERVLRAQMQNPDAARVIFAAR